MLIRTKDGIFEVDREIDDDRYGKAYLVNTPPSRWEYDEDTNEVLKSSQTDGFWEYEVLKKADTLDELIDEVVDDSSVYDNNKVCDIRIPYQTKAQAIRLTLRRLHSFGVRDVYGSIWVKGKNGVPILKPIAKMNDKGDLKLI